MITDIFLTILYLTIKGLLTPITLLPNVSLTSSIGSAITTANGYLAALNGFVPVDVFVIILGLVLGVEVSIWALKVISWILKKIPTIS
jgi:hypothetical protein